MSINILQIINEFNEFQKKILNNSTSIYYLQNKITCLQNNLLLLSLNINNINLSIKNIRNNN